MAGPALPPAGAFPLQSAHANRAPMAADTLTVQRSSFAALRFAVCRISLRAVTRIEFLPQEEGYKGGALHNRFESSLLRVSRVDHRLLCGSRDGRQKPYTLLPPLDRLLQYASGAEFSCDLTLIGDAIACFPACRQAFQLAGASDVGTMRGKFDVVRIEWISPGGAPRPVSNEEVATTHTICAEAVMNLHGIESNTVILVFRTPLRLQEASREIPDFYGFCRNLFKRLEHLCAYDSKFPGLNEPQMSTLLRLAKTVRIAEHSLKWYDWPRYAPAKDEWMRLGGHLGRIAYCGEIASFLPYLALGEWLHVGAHSSFGLGSYRIVRGDEMDERITAARETIQTTLQRSDYFLPQE